MGRGTTMAVAVAVLLLVGAVMLRTELERLHRVVTLFDGSRIAENFRSSESWGMPHRRMRRGQGPVAVLQRRKEGNVELPETFVDEMGQKWNLKAFLANHSTTGLVVARIESPQKAEVLYEDYWLGNTQQSRAISWSMGKSVVSAAFGIAVDQGHIELTKTVCHYLPALKGTGYENVTLKNVLQMSSGVGFDENYFSPISDINMMGYWLAFGFNIDNFVARLRREREPGSYNHYVSMDTQVLGLVIAAATNQTLSGYVEKQIWSKVGFESDATWLLDNEKNGVELSFGTIGATTRDYCRFGWLYLNEGQSPAAGGEQVVPKSWVRASVTPDSPHLMPDAHTKKLSNSAYFGYGYQWWVAPEEDDASKPSPNYMAIGVYNQFIGVFPEYQIVIAKNSAWAGYNGETIMKSEVETYRAFLQIAKTLGKKK